MSSFLDTTATMNLISEAFEQTNDKMDAYGHGVDVYRSEYREIYDAVVNSISGHSNAIVKTEQLSQTLASHREKLAALATYEEDAKLTRINQEQALQELQTQVEEMQQRGEQRRATAAAYRNEIEALKEELAKGSVWTEEQQEQRKELMSDITDLQHELELKQHDHLALASDVDRLLGMMEVEDSKVARLTEQVSEVEAQRTQLKEATWREQTRKVQQEEELHACQEAMRHGQLTNVERQAALRGETEAMAAMEKLLRDSKDSMEAYLAQYDALFRTIQHLSADLEKQLAANAELKQDNAHKLQVVQERQAQAAASRAEAEQLSRLRAAAVRKIESSEAERQDLEGTRDKIRAEIYRVSGGELRGARRQGEGLQRQLGDLQREKGILERKYTASDKASNLMADLTKITMFKSSVREKRSLIEQLVVERKRHEAEAEGHKARHSSRMEELKFQELQVSDLQRKILASTTKLKQQQNLYEAVRSDRNVYSKTLVATQDEIKEMRRRFKVMNHTIEQLKEEITLRDHALVKEHFRHHSADKEKEVLKNDVMKLRKQIASSGGIVSAQGAEISKLAQIIAEADEERQRQLKEHEAIVGERRVLHAQLTKRGAELTDLYSKIQLQTASLHQGEVLYQKLCTQVEGGDGLAAQVKSIERELAKGAQSAQDPDELRRVEGKLEAELLAEKHKVRALIDELEVPLNLHRWRRLESSDPERFEMLSHIQGLQGRVATTTEAIAAREAAIKEKEKLYEDLRAALARQPGAEVAAQLGTYQENLKDKVKQLKAMEGELSMYRQQVGLFKEEIDVANGEMRALNADWLARMEARWREQMMTGGAGGAAQQYGSAQQGSAETSTVGGSSTVAPSLGPWS
ncbi:hypothetical protein JKP88DRAFT_290085 [Tribonema minus]|uniref:Cilia- and flagella-associated protein 58 central coiled coil domain-containing protein n=1 Tax=Tribonema minus TaxID=303371 RepID=A0A835Z214_9STRA|nr:hypothetical protein JKP88DRAFT_290085 [Tribonema minus]